MKCNEIMIWKWKWIMKIIKIMIWIINNNENVSK